MTVVVVLGIVILKMVVFVTFVGLNIIFFMEKVLELAAPKTTKDFFKWWSLYEIHERTFSATVQGRHVCGSYGFDGLLWRWLLFSVLSRCLFWLWCCLSVYSPSTIIRPRPFFCLCSFYPSFAAHSSSLFPSTFFTLLSFHFPSLAASLRSSSHFSRLGIKTAVITNRLSELDTYPVGTLLCLADWS